RFQRPRPSRDAAPDVLHSANGARSAHASAMRIAPNQSGGRSRRPILMTSHVEPQTAQRPMYIASRRPESADIGGASYRIRAVLEAFEANIDRGLPKPELYRDLAKSLESLLEGETDPIANLANASG